MDLFNTLVIIITFVILAILIIAIRWTLRTVKKERILDLFDEGYYKRVKKNCQRGLITKPTDAFYRYYLAQALSMLGDYPKAMQLYEELAMLSSLPPDIPRLALKHKLAVTYRKQNYLTKAQAEYLSLLQDDPMDIEALIKVGEIFYIRGDFNNAAKLYERAFKINPRYDDVLLYLGKIYYEISQYQKGIEFLQEYLKVKNSNPETYFTLGLLYKITAKYKEAAIHFDYAERMNYRTVESRIHKISCMVMTDEYEEVIDNEDYFLLGSKSKDTLEIRYYIAQAYFKNRNIHKAIDQWELIANEESQFKDVDLLLHKYGVIKDNKILDIYLLGDDEAFKLLILNVLSYFNQKEEKFESIDSYNYVGVAISNDEEFSLSYRTVYYFYRGLEPLSLKDFKQVDSVIVKQEAEEQCIFSFMGFNADITLEEHYNRYKIFQKNSFLTILEKAMET